MGVVKVQSEKKSMLVCKLAHPAAYAGFTGCERKLNVSRTQVSFTREAKEIEASVHRLAGLRLEYYRCIVTL